jgi:hypothetical protein
MRVRESIYAPLGYKTTYSRQPRFRGSGTIDLCHAEKDGKRFVAVPAKEHFSRIINIQDSIPHMARMSEMRDGHVLMEVAPGELVWHLERIDNPQIIEAQLTDFVAATSALDLVHQDIRPWNVFWDGTNITVIDWGNSRFGKDGADAGDVLRMGRQMRGEITFTEAWGWSIAWHPAWCKRG